MEYKNDGKCIDISGDFLLMYHEIEKIMNLFKDDSITIREDAITAMYVQCIQHICNLIIDSKSKMGSSSLLTSEHILESQHINPRIQAKCINCIKNMRKMRHLLAIYDDSPYLQSNN